VGASHLPAAQPSLPPSPPGFAAHHGTARCDEPELPWRAPILMAYSRLSRGATLEERLWFHVKRGGPEDCWPWTGATARYGYGSINIGGKMRSVPRVVYELYVGPIGKLHVLHRCDFPACVNPGHLFLGTHLDNVRDMWCKGREPHPPTKLSAADVEVIRVRARAGERQRGLATEYGVSATLVCLIVNGRRRTPPRLMEEKSDGT